MLKIYKYPVAVADRQEVEMPKGASILCCQTQNDEPCLWAIVDPEASPSGRTILMFGTGHVFNNERYVPGASELRYIGTFQMAGGDLVYHVFEPNRR